MFLFAGNGAWEWLNYPGLEAWKFVNLAIFLAIAIFFLRRKVNEALLARRESIRQELIAAQKERERAFAKVAEADSLLSRLEADIETVHEQARQEAESERKRLADSAEREMEKLKQQAVREVETAAKIARKELRKYLAQRSVELARENVRRQMKPEDDINLIIQNIGELRRTTA
jgi:F-type H+-transporting ATPase subunit b